MIPKKIHYFWFGNNPKPEIVEKCLESWKKYFPEYEIIEWNETNYDVTKCAYVKEAYECRKWAFVSDYARFDILYHYGGIYFDTDVEVLKKFPPQIFENHAFTGVESTNVIAPGLVYACEKGDAIIKEILDDYETSRFLINGKQNVKTVNTRVTAILERMGFVPDGTFQVINGLAIYPAEYFCGYNLDLQEPDITKNTITIHHYAGSWMQGKDLAYLKARKILQKIIGKKNFMRLQNFVRKIKYGKQSV